MIQCDEAANELRLFSNHVQLDPERLQEVEARMGLLHQMGRKYQVDVSQLFTHHQTLQNELDALHGRMQSKQVLQADYEAALGTYHEAAQALRASRLHHAAQLSKEITEVIQQLGMPKGYVNVTITPLEKKQVHGQDKVEYTVCTNPGMPADILAKIASGGELSRMSLGIQLIAAKRGLTPTLIFDEVDVGIGGATAALVGQLLKKLGERLQVFCVTHQPQVASSAHHHFVVEKYVLAQQTFSRISMVEHDARVEEIARMLGGLTITDHTRSHARELLTL
jgi:DNA repair protein RecN (Recombination protein N)